MAPICAGSLFKSSFTRSFFSTGRQVPIIAGHSSGTQKSIGVLTLPRSLGRPEIYRVASAAMPDRRPVAEWTVVRVLLIATFTHSGFYPAVPERSLSTTVSVEYWNRRLPVVKMGDFEFHIVLLISLVEARPVLWDKTGDIYKDRNETKKVWREVCICLQEDVEALGDVKKRFWWVLP